MPIVPRFIIALCYLLYFDSHSLTKMASRASHDLFKCLVDRFGRLQYMISPSLAIEIMKDNSHQ